MNDPRDRRREYDGDVTYDVWRSGGNVDRINFDRVEDSYYNGAEAEHAARIELEHQRPHEPTDGEQIDQDNER